MAALLFPFASAIAVPDGYVSLILLQEEDSSFYLQVPLNIIHSLCLKPRKYLRYLGWCILGVEGVLALRHGGSGIDTTGDLENQGIYYYVVDAGTDLTQAVDLEVIKTRTSVPSETTGTPNKFRTRLLERDLCCVWSGAFQDTDGMHIIPSNRGAEWFRLIVENRPSYSEDVTQLYDIDDIRNGMMANKIIHSNFDRRDLVVLVTPNCMLRTKDVPPRHVRDDIPEDVRYSTHPRFTLHWLVSPEPFLRRTIPNHSDATFKKSNRNPKPSELLLHYNYGAAAVKCWGRGKEVLQRRAKPPRPRVLVPEPMGPSKTRDDRSTAIGKRNATRPAGSSKARAQTSTGTEELVESDDQALWDEDDVMLFCWGNSPAAKQRHLKKVQETTQRMEQWREGVPHGSV